MAKGINWLDGLLIRACTLALLGIALYHSRKVRRQGDVLRAARSISQCPIGLSMNTFLGDTGWVNRLYGRLQTISEIDAEPEVQRGGTVAPQTVRQAQSFR